MLRSVAVFESAGIGAVVEAEVLLRSVGQQVEEGRAGFVLGVHLFGLLHHLQRLVIAAGRDAGRAALAQVAETKMEKMPPEPGALRSGDEKMAFTFW